MKNLQKGFGVMVVLIIIALLAVAGEGVYLAVKQKGKISPTPETTTPSLQTENQTTSQKVTSTPNSGVAVNTSNTTNVSLTPKETFIKFRKKFDLTKTFDEAFAVSVEYATAERASFFKSQLAQVTEEIKTQLFPTLKSVIPQISSVTIVSENITGNIATLQLKNINDIKATGTATLKKESGLWKIESEAWTSKPN